MTGWGTASRHKKSTNLAAPRVGQPSVTGELGGKIHELRWRMNTEVQLLKEVQKIDI